MHTVNQIVDIVTHVTTKSRSRVSLLARRLTDGGVLPKSRGRHIKLVDRSAAVALLFTAARADRVEDAVSTSQAFAALPYQRHVGGYDPVENKTGETPRAIFHEFAVQPNLTLAQCLDVLLAPNADRRCTLTVSRDVGGQPSAVVKIHTETGVSSSVHFYHDSDAKSRSRETFELSADDFDALRELLAREGGVSFTGAAMGGDGDGGSAK